MTTQHTFTKVPYEELSARQKENCNYSKFAARLADYGFNCMRLSDDWLGADFLAIHVDNKTFLKVQLKGRLSLDEKYCGSDIYISFISGSSRDGYYIYPHDRFLKYCENNGHPGGDGWNKVGRRSWTNPPRWALEWFDEYTYKI